MTFEDILHALFYIAMLVLGVVLFFVCGDIANAYRDLPGVGGAEADDAWCVYEKDGDGTYPVDLEICEG